MTRRTDLLAARITENRAQRKYDVRAVWVTATFTVLGICIPLFAALVVLVSSQSDQLEASAEADARTASARSDDYFRECFNLERPKAIRSLYCDSAFSASEDARRQRELAARAGNTDKLSYVMFFGLLGVAVSVGAGAYQALRMDSRALATAQENRLQAEANLEQAELDQQRTNTRRTSTSRRIAGR